VPVEPLIIRGRIVTLDRRSRVIEEGALYVGADEKITAIRQAGPPAPEGFESARVLDTGGSVYPGLIDLHNHIAYNVLPLWASPTRSEPWLRRDQWPDDPDYKPSISLPANALCRLAGEATLKYVETKAVIGGTTAIQGSAKVPHYDGWLVRNVEKETFKKAKNVSVRQSVRELEKPADFAKYRKAMDDGYSFIYHLAEGRDPSLIEEFDAARRNKLLHKRLLAIHSSALTEAEFKKWRPKGSIVWSPFSNLWSTATPPRPTGRPRPACGSASARTGHRRRPRTCSGSSRWPTCATASSSARRSTTSSSCAWRPRTRPRRSGGTTPWAVLPRACAPTFS